MFGKHSTRVESISDSSEGLKRDPHRDAPVATDRATHPKPGASFTGSIHITPALTPAL